jgi:pimeloyl-ACP methyl ester carboxylesterase
MDFFEGTVDPAHVPAWLEAAGIDRWAAAFEPAGFTGALNWYRAMDAGWRATAAFAGAPVTVPAVFLYGDRDPVIPHVHRSVVHLKRAVPALRETIIVAGAGHWVHLEAPHVTIPALVRFLRDGC